MLLQTVYCTKRLLSWEHIQGGSLCTPNDNICSTTGGDTKLLSGEMLALPPGTTTVYLHIDSGIALYLEGAS